MTQTGSVYSFTIVADPPETFKEQAPYLLAWIQLDNGSMITAQLTDIDEKVEIGMRVEMVTRKLRTEGVSGMIVYGYKFRPLIEVYATQ